MPPDMGDSFHQLKGSEHRLWQLIEERSRLGGDMDEIDRRIGDLFGEDWAIVFTDLSGFSRHVAKFGILHFLEVIHHKRQLLLPIVFDQDGLLIKSEGDSFLLLFRRPERAVACCVRMQAACAEFNQGRAPEDQVLLCVGVGFGRVLRIGDSDVWGKEVNATSKLGEDTAKSDEILLTQAVRDAVAGHLPHSFEEHGHGFETTETTYRLKYRS